MTEQEKLVQIDLEKARKVGRSIEFIATFGSIALSRYFVGFWGALVIGIAAYAIVNMALEINLRGIKDKLGL